jgi:hypothetical protein
MKKPRTSGASLGNLPPYRSQSLCGDLPVANPTAEAITSWRFHCGVRASFSCTDTTLWCSGSITIPGAGRSAAMENHFPFRCAPRIAGLRWALEKRRPQHFGDSCWASKESRRHSSSPPAAKKPRTRRGQSMDMQAPASGRCPRVSYRGLPASSTADGAGQPTKLRSAPASTCGKALTSSLFSSHQ